MFSQVGDLWAHVDLNHGPHPYQGCAKPLISSLTWASAWDEVVCGIPVGQQRPLAVTGCGDTATLRNSAGETVDSYSYSSYEPSISASRMPTTRQSAPAIPGIPKRTILTRGHLDMGIHVRGGAGRVGSAGARQHPADGETGSGSCCWPRVSNRRIAEMVEMDPHYMGVRRRGLD